MSTIVIRSTGPCPCCFSCDEPVITDAILQCRTRGGTATLCGYSEYADASTPPRKYRNIALSGGFTIRWFSNSNCTTPTETARCNYSGNCTISATTCGTISTGEQECGGAPIAACALPEDRPTYTTLFTATTATLQPTNACVTSSGPGGFAKVTDIDAVTTLSVEDTETDAITRLLAGSGGTWGAWTTTGDGTGGTCQPHICCKAHYFDRSPGFSFAYQESQWRLKPTDQPLAAGCYKARVSLYRRAAGSSDEWVEFAVENIDGLVVDGAGNVSGGSEVNVPNTEGWETYASNLRLCRVTCP